MIKKENLLVVPDEVVLNKIYVIRNQKVMLDRDLAELYQVETKALKQSVKRNMDIFPQHFMFELTENEFEILRSQFVTSKNGRGGTRYLPMAFTEHGVLQLSNVVRSGIAKQMSIRIIDVFVKMRQMLTDNTELRLDIEKIKKKLDNQDKNMEIVFRYLDELIEKKENSKERTLIGYQISKKK